MRNKKEHVEQKWDLNVWKKFDRYYKKKNRQNLDFEKKRSVCIIH